MLQYNAINICHLLFNVYLKLQIVQVTNSKNLFQRNSDINTINIPNIKILSLYSVIKTHLTLLLLFKSTWPISFIIIGLHHYFEKNYGSNPIGFAREVTEIINSLSWSHNYNNETRCARDIISIIQLHAEA